VQKLFCVLRAGVLEGRELDVWRKVFAEGEDVEGVA
jgi:hypothetical protein